MTQSTKRMLGKSLMFATALAAMHIPAAHSAVDRHGYGLAPTVEIHLEALAALQAPPQMDMTSHNMAPDAPIDTQTVKPLMWQEGPKGQPLPATHAASAQPAAKGPMPWAKAPKQNSQMVEVTKESDTLPVPLTKSTEPVAIAKGGSAMPNPPWASLSETPSQQDNYVLDLNQQEDVDRFTTTTESGVRVVAPGTEVASATPQLGAPGVLSIGSGAPPPAPEPVAKAEPKAAAAPKPKSQPASKQAKEKPEVIKPVQAAKIEPAPAAKEQPKRELLGQISDPKPVTGAKLLPSTTKAEVLPVETNETGPDPIKLASVEPPPPPSVKGLERAAPLPLDAPQVVEPKTKQEGFFSSLGSMFDDEEETEPKLPETAAAPAVKAPPAPPAPVLKTPEVIAMPTAELEKGATLPDAAEEKVEIEAPALPPVPSLPNNEAAAKALAQKKVEAKTEKPAAKPAEKEMASLGTPAPASPKLNVGPNGLAAQVVFKESENKLDDAMKNKLRSVADTLVENPNLRVSLVGHASGSGDHTSRARSVSLSRALAVRSYLIDSGVDNLRINTNALGSENPGSSPDRVDVFLLAPTEGDKS